jgi:hypothetical protein
MRAYVSPVCPYPDLPCRVPDRAAVRVVGWRTLAEKANWLDGAASLDALRKGTQAIAQRFLNLPTAETRTRAIQRFVRDGVRYTQDFRVTQGHRGEEFADTVSALVRGYGDCDDKARAFVALVRAAERQVPLGAQARIRPVFTRHPLEFVHVQAEARWWGSDAHPAAMPGGWLLCELILARCEIGQNPDELPRGPDGQRLIA